MSVLPDDVQVGKCFVTSAGQARKAQVRKVTEITEDGRVGYEARGSSYQLGAKAWHIAGPPRGNWPDRATFAAQVEREVDCTWDPSYPEPAAK